MASGGVAGETEEAVGSEYLMDGLRVAPTAEEAEELLLTEPERRRLAAQLAEEEGDADTPTANAVPSEEWPVAELSVPAQTIRPSPHRLNPDAYSVFCNRSFD